MMDRPSLQTPETLTSTWRRDVQQFIAHGVPPHAILAAERLEKVQTAIAAARLRLDAIRLVVEGMW